MTLAGRITKFKFPYNILTDIDQASVVRLDFAARCSFTSKSKALTNKTNRLSFFCPTRSFVVSLNKTR